MANIHFGNIGDIWKHLLLAEILTRESPTSYWETHAGSASYPLSPSPEREYGVYYFDDNSRRSGPLSESHYRQILSDALDREPETYPGSPLIAMRTHPRPADAPSDDATDEPWFVFCDVDSDSLDTIRRSAQELGLDERVRTVHADGISTVADELESGCPKPTQTFLHIDPFDPFERGTNGITPVDLFRRASHEGLQAMLWYGFETTDERESLGYDLRTSLDSERMGPRIGHLWRGEIECSAIDDPDVEFHLGVFGCGVLCANVSNTTLGTCDRLGMELASIYESATFPTGEDGTLSFTGSRL